MTAAEAHAAAEAEGLTLLRAETATGFVGVCRQAYDLKPFRAYGPGGHIYLGQYVTPEEAALAVARYFGPAGVPAEAAAKMVKRANRRHELKTQPTLTAAEAHAAAEAEGLTLMRFDNATGFRSVTFHRQCKAKPFQANPCRNGKHEHLGHFATAEEAALAVARWWGPEGIAAILATPMTAEEALAAAEAEGLSLLRAENTTGYLNVSRADNYIHPYRAHFTHKMRKVDLGRFSTAEEAALAVARFFGSEGNTPRRLPMTAREALAALLGGSMIIVQSKVRTFTSLPFTSLHFTSLHMPGDDEPGPPTLPDLG